MNLSAALLPADTQGERRGAKRHLLKLGSIAGLNGDDVPAVVSDLSATGLKLQSAMSLPIGSELEIELLEGQRFGAEVTRSTGQTYGCKFEVPIPATVLWSVLLRATFEAQDPSTFIRLDEEAETSSPTFVLEEREVEKVDSLKHTADDDQAWFDQLVRSGEVLIGFRTSGKRVYAIVARPSSN